MASQPHKSIYEPVLHKKTGGKLVLSQGSFQFEVETSANNEASKSNGLMVDLSWNTILKHQVSPVSHPKFLLKIVLVEGAGKPLTFQLTSRSELETIRKDVTQRLRAFKSQHSSLLQSFATPSKSMSSSGATSGNKRKRDGISSSTNEARSLLATGRTTKVTYGELDPTSLAVTRSSLLASNPTLRSQHKYLVEESKTITEDDFWNTHKSLLEEEYARISGITRAGTSSLLQSHLQVLTGRITLGVEEMRQIFIMYPAVHKAYEEKVPLELSDEQFWRKYLESEYFHRDRGRVGAASGRQNASNQNKNVDPASGANVSKKSKTDTKDQEARAAVVAADDLFSRYDQKLRESGKLDDGVFSRRGSGVDNNLDGGESQQAARKKLGTKLAIGQFDLASTLETEGVNLLQGPMDYHPVEENNTIGAKVIQKYNRHWAMVLNPEEAVAGSNLMEVARNSVQDAIPYDSDPMPGGGMHEEMERLIGFANASEENANHALGVGESDEYEILKLKNVDVYYNNKGKTNSSNDGDPEDEDPEVTRKKEAQLAKYMAGKTKKMFEDIKNQGGISSSPGSIQQTTQLEDAFPPPSHGKQLLMALTKRMAQDSKTDADTLEVVNHLPLDFKKRLHTYFRRTSELLRHFFGLRKLALETEEAGNEDSNAYKQKLQKIVTGLETLYNEIGDMRKEQQVTGTKGKVMGAMCYQIMEQLDWAFKCYREGTHNGSGGSSGGFTTIETF